MTNGKEAIIVVGLGYGDEGKGSVVDYLVRKKNAHTVVRYNGGPQAAHNVVLPNGTHHTFAMWGSGTLVPGVDTFLGEKVLINPINMMMEEKHLREIGVYDAWDRMYIDSDCRVITPYQVQANRLREIDRAGDAHGSCGQGIGETIQDWLDDVYLTINDFSNYNSTERILRDIANKKRAELGNRIDVDNQNSPSYLAEFYCNEFYSIPWHFGTSNSLMGRDGVTIFEGAQGVLLDETHGFPPYNTWSDTTTRNAKEILYEADYDGEVKTLGLTRAYSTRHGNGPFIPERTIAANHATEAKLSKYEYNKTNAYQGEFRLGPFDMVAFNYALSLCEVDSIGITHLDTNEYQYFIDSYIHEGFLHRNIRSMGIKIEDITQMLMIENDILPEETHIFNNDICSILENTYDIEISLKSHGPTFEDKESTL